jgi:ribosome-binding factor A
VSRRPTRGARGGARAEGPNQRQLRVGEALRHALVEIFAADRLHDPELIGRSITVSEVRVSPDLTNATVFVAPLGGGDGAALARALNRASPFLRGELAREVDLRVAPRVTFEPDTTFDYAERIDRLLHAPEVARDLKPSRAKPARRRSAPRGGTSDGA